MSKKSFRARKVDRPDYPRLADLDTGGLRRWGLAAVGGLLIGGSACRQPRTAGEAESPKTVTVVPQSAQDAGRAVPNIPPSGVLPVQRVEQPRGPDGEPPAQRVEKEGSNQGETSEKAKGQPVNKTKVKPLRERPHVDHATLAGKMRVPRVDPTWDEKKTDKKAEDK